MLTLLLLPALFLFSQLTSALPTTQSISARGPSQCDSFSSIQTGSYTIYANEWGAQYATSGSQCSQINGLNGNTLSWSTSWNWAGVDNQVKSYTNVETGFPSKPLSQYGSIQTAWSWSYTGTNLAANVAFDTFLSSSPSGSASYEVMVWLGVYGNISPLSSNGYPPTPIATPTIAGVLFNLILGTNGAVTVYSFVAQSQHEDNWQGDLMEFYQYLEAQGEVSGNEYLTTVQAGSEVFVGENGNLVTTGYSIVVD